MRELKILMNNTPLSTDPYLETLSGSIDRGMKRFIGKGGSVSWLAVIPAIKIFISFVSDLVKYYKKKHITITLFVREGDPPGSGAIVSGLGEGDDIIIIGTDGKPVEIERI